MSEQKPWRTAKSSVHFLSGLGSGVVSAILLQPLDLLKTRVQQSGTSSLTASFRELSQSSHPVYSLWRGTVPSALRMGFGTALYFTTLNTIRQHILESSIRNDRDVRISGGTSVLPKLSNTANLLSGAVARAFAGFVLMPLTVLKVRFESSLYSYPSMRSAAFDIYKTEKARGFFVGYGATAIRDAPYAGMYIVFYERLKSRLGVWVDSPASETRPGTRTVLAGSVNFISGLLAGAACSIVSNPFDAAKTRIQVQPRIFRNTAHALRKMITEDGLRSLWDGLALRMARKTISSALAWTVYEELIRKFSRSQQMQ